MTQPGFTPGPGSSGGSGPTIDDTTPSGSTVYSSTKTDALTTGKMDLTSAQTASGFKTLAGTKLSGNVQLGTDSRTAAFTLFTGSSPYQRCNATSSAFAMTLPTTTTNLIFIFEKTDASANTVTIQAGGSGNIDGGTIVLTKQFETVIVMGAGTNDVWTVLTARGLAYQTGTLSLAQLPAGASFKIYKVSGNWKFPGPTGATITSRPTARTDLTMEAVSTDGSVPSFAVADLDITQTAG